jgi:hypothetical protein
MIPKTITYTVPKTGTLDRHESANRVIGSVSYDPSKSEAVGIVQRLKKEFNNVRIRPQYK